MNTLDIIILILFIPGIIRGLTKGFLQQAIALVGIVISAWIAKQFFPRVAEFLSPLTGLEGQALDVLSFAIVLIVALVILLLLAKLLTKVVEMATLGWLNRALGVFLSIFITAIVIGFLATVFDTLDAKFNIMGENTLIKDSLLYGYLRDFAEAAFPYLKQIIAPAAEAVTEAVNAV